MYGNRPILLALIAFGLQVGLVSAAEPQAPLPNPSALPTAVVTPIPQANLPADAEVTDGGLGCFNAGVGLYLLQPYFQSNPAYHVLTENQTVQPALITVDRVDVSSHVEVAPLFWLAYLTEGGWGGRARYWYFREGTSQTVSFPPFQGGTLVTLTSAAPLGLQAFGNTITGSQGEATSFNVLTKLQVQLFDLEGIEAFQGFGWNFLVSGGVRLARIDQTYNVYDAQSSSINVYHALLSSWRFQGAGPVVALEGRRPLTAGGLALYGSARGALLFGYSDQNASFSGIQLRNNDPDPQISSQRRYRGLPIGELELGLEYNHNVGPACLFGRIGLVAQDWVGAGGASHSAAGTPGFSPNPVQGGAPVDTDLAFFGLALRLGVSY
jgi:hypothetical protein